MKDIVGKKSTNSQLNIIATILSILIILAAVLSNIYILFIFNWTDRTSTVTWVMIIVCQFALAAMLSLAITRKIFAVALLASLIIWLFPGSSVQLFIAGWIPALFSIIVLTRRGNI